MPNKRIYLPKHVRRQLGLFPERLRDELQAHLENVSVMAQQQGFPALCERLPRDPHTNRFLWSRTEGKAFFSVDPANGVVFVHAVELVSGDEPAADSQPSKGRSSVS